jgi:hypothetical protein
MWSAGLSWLCSCTVTRIVCLRGPMFCTLAGKQLAASHSYTGMNTKDLLVCDVTLGASFSYLELLLSHNRPSSTSISELLASYF